MHILQEEVDADNDRDVTRSIGFILGIQKNTGIKKLIYQ